MKFTLKHYYAFGQKAKEIGGNLISRDSWDAVRLNAEDESTPFAIPRKREDWIKKCLARNDMAQRAAAINAFLKERGFSEVISLGAGACLMEYNLVSQNPNIALRCSDYSPQSIRRLQELFIEAKEVGVFNMLEDTWQPAPGWLYIMHRIDTDFTNAQWSDVFDKMDKAGINNVLFVPSHVYTIGDLIKIEASKWYQRIVKRSELSFAGYLRTKDAFFSLFSDKYRLEEEFPVYDLQGFFLRKK